MMAPVLVSGAASGIGQATARLAAERGHAVIMLDQDGAALERSAGQLRDLRPAQLWEAAVDVCDQPALSAALDDAIEAVGVPRKAVCCAGIDRGGPTHEQPIEDFDLVLDVNLRGTFLTCREVISRLLARSETGAIVCVSSVAAFTAVPGGASAYCASKGGVTALVRSLAVEYAEAGIRINALVPGATETPLMWANVSKADREAMRGVIGAEVPMGRLAQPREQAQAALWLLSDEAAYVTGSQLAVDGGVLARCVLSA
jgi:NAD(P)-dependent dehydrogenase (short-subunit alcohol dehydrogenase family)